MKAPAVSVMSLPRPFFVCLNCRCANPAAGSVASQRWHRIASVMSNKAFKPEVAQNGVVRIPKAVFESLPPPAEKASGAVIGVIKRLDGTIDHLTNVRPNNPNFAPRKTTWGNNVTSNKEEALIKYHERKGIPLPPELQVSGRASPRAAHRTPHAHALHDTPIASYISPLALSSSRAPHAARCTPHAARRTPPTHAARPAPEQAKKVQVDAAAAEKKGAIFGRLGGGKARGQAGSCQPGGAFSRLAGKALGEIAGAPATPAAAEPARPPRPKGGIKVRA